MIRRFAEGGHGMNARTFSITILAAVLALLTLASSAWAECAWVLWQQSLEAGLSDPKPQLRGVIVLSAHESRKGCDDAMEKEIETGVKIGGRRLPTGVMVVKPSDTGARDRSLIVTFRCLPDTIDPRGEKTK